MYYKIKETQNSFQATSKNCFANDLRNTDFVDVAIARKSKCLGISLYSLNRNVLEKISTFFLPHHSELFDPKRNRKIPRKKRKVRKSSFIP